MTEINIQGGSEMEKIEWIVDDIVKVEIKGDKMTLTPLVQNGAATVVVKARNQSGKSAVQSFGVTIADGVMTVNAPKEKAVLS